MDCMGMGTAVLGAGLTNSVEVGDRPRGQSDGLHADGVVVPGSGVTSSPRPGS